MNKPVMTALIAALLCPLYAAADLQVACTEQKPYYYQNSDGKMAGQFYNTAKAVLDRAGVSADYSIMNWQLLYASGLEKENFMISCLGRTPLTEDSFHWIGPVAKSDKYAFYKLKSNSAFVSYLEDFEYYKVGIQDIPHMSDFINAKNLDSSTQTAPTKVQLMQMLKSGRVDFVLLEAQDVKNEAQQMGLKPGDLVSAFYAYTLVESLAVSQSTPEETVEQLREAYNTLEAEGKIILQ